MPECDYDADAASFARDPKADERAKYNAVVAAAVADDSASGEEGAEDGGRTRARAKDGEGE